MNRGSGGSSAVVLENAAETFDFTDSQFKFRSRIDDTVFETLMISLSVVMSDIGIDDVSKMAQSKDDHLVQSFRCERQEPAFHKRVEAKVLSDEY